MKWVEIIVRVQLEEGAPIDDAVDFVEAGCKRAFEGWDGYPTVKSYDVLVPEEMLGEEG